MNEFVSGAIVMGYSVAALYFLKFSRTTGDRLFVFFATAFALLAAQRVMLVAFHVDAGMELASYALRVLAFLVLIVGIIDKNRYQSRSRE